MAEHRHLGNAPIAEALVDLRTLLQDDFDLGRFRVLGEQLGDRFPAVELLHGQTMTLKVEAGKPATTTATFSARGYLFRSADGKTIAQFRRDGFTFNRLRPYTSWDELGPQALELWEMYRTVANPPPCSRIALRYVNQIDVTAGDISLASMLTALPGVPHDRPRLLNEFFTRVVLADPDTGLTAAITQATQPAPGGTVALILLDIDTYRAASAGIPDREVAPTLNALRKLKNDIFFGSITDAIVNRYA